MQDWDSSSEEENVEEIVKVVFGGDYKAMIRTLRKRNRDRFYDQKMVSRNNKHIEIVKKLFEFK